MLKANLCDYNDAYILVKGTISVVPVPLPAVNGKEIVFKNCAPLTDCICII